MSDQQQPVQSVPTQPSQAASQPGPSKLTDKNSYSLYDKGDSYQNVLVRLGMAKTGTARP